MGISKRRVEMGEEAWKEYQKQRRNKKVVKYRKNVKWRLVLYKGGKCEKCDYDKKVPAAYAFHHLDHSEKEFGIAKGYGKGLKALYKEVNKCKLLCVRCHAEIHDEEDYNQ
tara:strand:+ start:6161 stop:6493 length:333 start_codon:yes stop_codon:yes gene_type:complete